MLLNLYIDSHISVDSSELSRHMKKSSTNKNHLVFSVPACLAYSVTHLSACVGGHVLCVSLFPALRVTQGT